MLRVVLVSVNGEPVAHGLAAEFSHAGGGIGRDERNTLVLPDPERRLSRVQAVVRFVDGVYHLIDQGTTITCINGRRMGQGNSVVLRDGDVIEAAGYRLQVTLRPSRLAKVPVVKGHVPAAPMAPHIPAAAPAVPSAVLAASAAAEVRPWGVPDPLDALGGLPESEPDMAAFERTSMLDPFSKLLDDELPGKPVVAPGHPAAPALGHKLGCPMLAQVLEPFRPENLALRLAMAHSQDEDLPADRKARLWTLYERHYAKVFSEVIEELQALCDGEAHCAPVAPDPTKLPQT